MKHFCCSLVLAATLLSANAQQPATLPSGHPLLITTVRTGDTEVFAVDPITGDAKNLSRSPLSEDRYASWSYDGKLVTFTSNRAGGSDFNVYIMDADGRNVRQVTHEKGVCYYPNFTADGKTIEYSFADDKAGIAQIMLISPNGSNRRVVCDGRDGHISADGKKVVFTKKAEKGYPLYTVDVDGKNIKQITPDHGNDMGAVGPVWSPDAKQILYVDQVKDTNGADRLEIFVCNADGSGVKQLTHLNQISTSPAWSPDGQWVTFRVTDNAFWQETDLRERTYQEKRADKRPVYALQLNGSSQPQLIEPLHYQCGIDGSRGNWRPTN
jgi:TolB protein